MSTSNFTAPSSGYSSKSSPKVTIPSYGQNNDSGNTKGYKIIIIILAVIVLVVSAFFFLNVRDLEKANGDLALEQVSLTNELSLTIDSLNNITTENKEISELLDIQKEEATSLLNQLNKERKFSRSKIKQYEEQLGTLRSVMQSYVYQIDSLNTANKVLAEENIQFRSKLEISTLRASSAEETSQELTAKLRKGSFITARDIEVLVSRKPNGKKTKAKRAKSMKIDFALSANAIATPGTRTIYCVVTSPEGYQLAESSTSLFEYEGSQMSYTASRDIDYQNSDLKVTLYYDCNDLISGEYSVALYMDSAIIGSTVVIL